MSDQNTSDSPVTGSETNGTPAVSTPTASTPANTFGAVRGSGLLRGKPSRTSQPAASAPAVSPDYTPTSVSVITSEREYQNPFASETPAPAAKLPPASTPAAPAAGPVTKAPEPAPAVQARPSAPATSAASSEEAEATLDILPPEPVKRASVSWETSGFPQTPAPRQHREPVERPAPAPLNTDPNRIIPEKNIYRPENQRPIEPRESRDSRDSSKRSPLEQSNRLPPPPEKPKTPVGFFSWFKGLFGKKKVEEKPVSHDSGERDHDHQGRRRNRRRNRGGRSFDSSREGHSAGQPSSSREEGGHRNEGGRRRGGRRHHHDGPRSDGSSSG